MNIEILRVSNGYMVKPVHSYANQGMCMIPNNVWVFQTYSQLRDELQRILEQDEPK